jgi:hypothetical protein
MEDTGSQNKSFKKTWIIMKDSTRRIVLRPNIVTKRKGGVCFCALFKREYGGGLLVHIL